MSFAGRGKSLVHISFRVLWAPIPCPYVFLGKLGVGLLFSEMFPKLTGPSWSLEGGRGGPRDGKVPPAQPPVATEHPAVGAQPRHRPGGMHVQ